MSTLNMEDVFAKIESAAEKNALLPRESNILRLLGEEMLSMTLNLADNADCSFEIWNNEKRFELRLRAMAKISPESKRDFVSLSSKKENILAKGLIGKIGSAMEDYLYNVGSGNYLMFCPDPLNGYAQIWTLNDYMLNTSPEEQKEDWDGLERSILMNTADDIIIGVNNGQVEMTVKKAF
ncbi:MAG TPA: hypothetical protein VHR42_08610 [Clostridia bacterium]|nr:hypothetical protein [Clostridia bacterium]